MGIPFRSKSPFLSYSPSEPPPIGEAPSNGPRIITAISRRPSEPLAFRRLGRPLRQGERQLLTLIAHECVDALLTSKREEAGQTTHDDRGKPQRRNEHRKNGVV